MANKQDIRDAFWDKLSEEIFEALESQSCLSYSYCKDVANDVVNSISDSLLDEILAEEQGTTDVLEFLIRLKSRYYHTLEAPEQRELDKLLIELVP